MPSEPIYICKSAICTTSKKTGTTNLDSQKVLNLVQAGCGCKASNGIKGKSRSMPGEKAITIAAILCRKHELHVGQIARLGQFDANDFGPLDHGLDFALRLVALVVVSDFFVDGNGDLVDRDAFGLAHPVRVGRDFCVDSHRIEGSIRPPW